MALFDNLDQARRMDVETLSYRNSRNLEEYFLFSLVNQKHKELLRCSTNGSTSCLSKIVRDHSSTIRSLLKRAIEYRRNGQKAEKRELLAMISMERVSLRSALKLLQLKAFHDPLTNLHNRGAFDQYLAKLVLECATERTSFALICIDVVFFKALNTVFGELIGDEVLRTIANSLRPTEVVSLTASRTGGDEFAVLLSFKGVQRNNQIASLKSILDRLSIATNNEIASFIEQKLNDGTSTRSALNGAIQKIYTISGTSSDLSPRIRLAGVLVTHKGFAFRHVVNRYCVARVDEVDPDRKYCTRITGKTIQECCKEIVQMTKDDVALSKCNENTTSHPQ